MSFTFAPLGEPESAACRELMGPATGTVHCPDCDVLVACCVPMYLQIRFLRDSKSSVTREATPRKDPSGTAACRKECRQGQGTDKSKFLVFAECFREELELGPEVACALHLWTLQELFRTSLPWPKVASQGLHLLCTPGPSCVLEAFLSACIHTYTR